MRNKKIFNKLLVVLALILLLFKATFSSASGVIANEFVGSDVSETEK